MQTPGFPFVFVPPHGYPVPVPHAPGAQVYYVPGVPPHEAAGYPGYPAVYPVHYVPAPPPAVSKGESEAKAAEGQPHRAEIGALPMGVHPYPYHPYAMAHPPAATYVTTAEASNGAAAKSRETSATADVSPISTTKTTANVSSTPTSKAVHVHVAGVPPPPPHAMYSYYPPHFQHPYYMSARPPPGSKAIPATSAAAAAPTTATKLEQPHSRPLMPPVPLSWLQHGLPDPTKGLPHGKYPHPLHHLYAHHAPPQQHPHPQGQSPPAQTSSSPEQTLAEADAAVGRSKWSTEAVVALERLVTSYEGTQIKRDDFYANVHDELAVLGYTHSKRAIQTKIGMLGLLNKVKIQFTWTEEEDKAAMSRLARSSDFGAILQQLKSRGLCVGRSLQDFEKRCREYYLPTLQERKELQEQDPASQSTVPPPEFRPAQPTVRQMREWTQDEELAVAELVRPYVANGEQINWHAVREELVKRGLCVDRTENAIACHYRKTPRKRKRNLMRMPVQFHSDEELLKKQKQIRKQLFSNPSEASENDDQERSNHNDESDQEEEKLIVVQDEHVEPWTPQEDEVLLELILASHPPYDWVDILGKMQEKGLAMNRSTRQILHRYCHHYRLEVSGAEGGVLEKFTVAAGEGSLPELSRRGELAKVDITETLSVMASTRLRRGEKPSFPDLPTPSVDSRLFAAQTIVNGLEKDMSSRPSKEIVGMALVLGWTYHVPTASTSLPIDKSKGQGVWVRSDVACESISAASAKKGMDFFESNADFSDYLKRLYAVETTPSTGRAT